MREGGGAERNSEPRDRNGRGNGGSGNWVRDRDGVCDASAASIASAQPSEACAAAQCTGDEERDRERARVLMLMGANEAGVDSGSSHTHATHAHKQNQAAVKRDIPQTVCGIEDGPSVFGTQSVFWSDALRDQGGMARYTPVKGRVDYSTFPLLWQGSLELMHLDLDPTLERPHSSIASARDKVVCFRAMHIQGDDMDLMLLIESHCQCENVSCRPRPVQLQEFEDGVRGGTVTDPWASHSHIVCVLLFGEGTENSGQVFCSQKRGGRVGKGCFALNLSNLRGQWVCGRPELKAAIVTKESSGHGCLVKGIDLPLLVFWKNLS